MNKKYLKKYSDLNPEKFNNKLIEMRDDSDILEYVKEIFKTIEVIQEIKVEDVKIETDESSFGPIVNDGFNKAILESRLNKITYKVRITPSESVPTIPLLLDENDEEFKEIKEKKLEEAAKENLESEVIEKSIFLNKLIDNSFYINEGCRYFLTYQIVDNATYSVKNSISLKSLLMPITITNKDDIELLDINGERYSFPTYDILLFSKKINPILFVLGKIAYNAIAGMEYEDESNILIERQNYIYEEISNKLNKFWRTKLRFNKDDSNLDPKNYIIFKMNDEFIVEVPKEDIEDPSTKNLIGTLFTIFTNDSKKKPMSFTYSQFISPMFWIDKVSTFFTQNNDLNRKFEKVKTFLISLERIMDKQTYDLLKTEHENKQNTLCIIRYILNNFKELSKKDSQDLDNKRIRLYEYQLLPLRILLSEHILIILNSPTRSKDVLKRMFTSLQNMCVIKQTIANELLRYYNSTNEMNLYTSLLKYSFKGIQSISKVVSTNQRDVHPSYTGRLSLVGSNASDPGMSGTICPFAEIFGNGYFSPQENFDDSDKSK